MRSERSAEGYDYERSNVVEAVEQLAQARLSGPTTLEITVWDDGDFRVVAYHTIGATFPYDAVERGTEKGRLFHRERIAFTTVGDAEGWLRHEVVRRCCGETEAHVLHSTRFAGYTPNWPAPIEDESDEDDSDGPSIPYQGRFA